MENFSKYEYCPICNARNIECKFNNIQGINGLDDTFDMFHCKNCNAYFIAQQTTPEYIERFYNQNNEDSLSYNEDNSKFLNYYYRNLKNKIEKLTGIKGKILDIGCSCGYFLDAMEGWDRYGCEISQEHANIAKSKYGDNIFCGSIENYQKTDEYFDVITLQDCLDHMIDPNSIIKICHRLLKQGGIIVIKAHNSDCLFAKLYGKKFYAIVPPAHLFLFNKKSITTLISRNGFKLIEYKFMPHLLSIATVFLRLSRGNRNSIFFSIYNYLDSSIFQNIGIHKDLHDIFTVFARKN